MGPFPRNGVPGGAAASRQHLRTRPASALPPRRRGGSFATASTHASCQCLAITPPPATRRRRRVGPSRVGVRMPQLFREGAEPLAGVPSASGCVAIRRVADRADRADRDQGAKLDPGSFQTGGSFATASTHASRQCLAITRPLSTLQLVRRGTEPGPHDLPTGRPCRLSLTHERLHGESDSQLFWGDQSPFQRASVSRQHLRTHQPALRRNGSK